MKKTFKSTWIFWLLAIIIIFSDIILAQSTTFEPEKLSQIFNWEYEEDGTAIQLYKTVRGRQLILGNLTGIITAEPPINVRVRNGKYSIIHDDISFTVEGDFIITKQSRTDYPLVTILDGNLYSSNMKFFCERRICTMMINSDDESIILIGESRIIGDFDEERIGIIAKNLIFKPLSTRTGILVNLSFEIEEENEPETNSPAENNHHLGKFELEKGSMGKYARIKYLDDVTQTQISRESIFGNVHILNIENPHEEWLRHDEINDLRLDFNGEELIKIKQGVILYVDENSFRAKCTPSTSKSCLYLNQINGESRIVLRKGSIFSVNLDNDAISSINLLQFRPEDAESELIAMKSSLNGRKIVFTRNNVIVDGNWRDFGISFSSYIYRPTQRRYDYLECKIEENKCYLNGQEVSLGRSAEGLVSCNADNDCDSGFVCESNRCIESRRCRQIIEGDSLDPLGANTIDILFIGENMESFEEIERAALDIVNGENGLFYTEPYKSHRNDFSIWVKPAPSARIFTLEEGVLPRHVGTPDIESIDLSNCPNAEIKVVLSNNVFNSHANFESRTCMISLLERTAPNTNLVFLHEFGHCFGDLSDEYHNLVSSITGNPRLPNCVASLGRRSAEEIAKEEWARLLSQEGLTTSAIEAETKKLIEEARKNWNGCGGSCGNACSNFLRPSENSIMRDHRIPGIESKQYNKISLLSLKEKIRNYVLL